MNNLEIAKYTHSMNYHGFAKYTPTVNHNLACGNIQCGCGSSIKKASLSNHRRSKKHREWQATQKSA
jgi:hypothetical protein